LLPVHISNSDGEVVFLENGLFYVEVDHKGRGTRLFRYEIGGDHNMVYEEPNTDFTLGLEKSGNFVILNIRSLFKPTTNEIWV
jgi:protease II